MSKEDLTTAASDAYLRLEITIKEDVQELLTRSFEASALEFSNLEDERIIQLSHEEGTSPSNRIESLRHLESNITKIVANLASSLEELRTHVLIIVLNNESLYDLRKRVDENVLKIIEKQKECTREEELNMKTRSESPYLKYENILAELQKIISLVHACILFHSLGPTELSLLLFEKLCGNLSFVSDLGGAPNWISINQVLIKIRTVQSAIEIIPSSKNKWMHPKESNYLASKLKTVSSKIFNSTECRTLAEVNVSHKADPLDEHFAQLVTFVDQSGWRTRDLDADPQYLTPREWLQMSFRHVCRNLPGYRLLEVEGDGNCFFRAAIKFIWPNIPRDVEDEYSLILRTVQNERRTSNASNNTKNGSNGNGEHVDKNDIMEDVNIMDHSDETSSHSKSDAMQVGEQDKMNTSNDDEYKGFMVEGETDSDTMAKPGVWADHLQVKKLSDRFKRCVYLLRCDDRSVILTPEGEIKPGAAYRIGAEAYGEENPFMFYFIPESHYEVFKKWDRSLDESSDELITRLKTMIEPGEYDVNVISIELIRSLILLSRDVDQISDFYGALSDYKVSYTDKNEIKDQMAIRIPQLKAVVSQFKELIVDHLGLEFLHRVKAINAGKFFHLLLESVFEENIDSLKDKNGNDSTSEPSTKRLKTITGPLFKMLDKLSFYEDNYKYSSWKTYGSSYSSSYSSSYGSSYGSSSSYKPSSSSSYTSSTYDSGSTYASSSNSSTHKPYTSSSWTSADSNLPPLRSVYHDDPPQPTIYTTNVPSYLSRDEPIDVVMDLTHSAGGSIIERDDATEAEWKEALKDAKRLTLKYAAKVSSVSLNALFNAVKDSLTIRELTFERCGLSEDCITVLATNVPEIRPCMRPIWVKYCTAPKSCRELMNNLELSSGALIILTTNFI